MAEPVAHHPVPSHPASETWVKVVEGKALNASLTHEVLRLEGIHELERRPVGLAWSGLASGLSMGLTLLAVGVLHHALPDTTWKQTAAALGYPFGFIVVILASQQLFTEHTVKAVVPLLDEHTTGVLRRVLVVWGVVFAANVVGTLLFAGGAALTAAFPPELRQSMRTVALESTSHDWATLFARAVPAGWLVGLLVWMRPAASHSKVFVIFLMAWLIGAAKLSHVIVHSVEAFYLMMLGDMSIARALGGVVLPALLGNIVGGALLVALVNHLQVEHEKPKHL